MIRLSCIITGDTLTLVNQDSNEHGCPDQKGVYAINFKENGFTLDLINDACEGRAHALTGVTWKDPGKK